MQRVNIFLCCLCLVSCVNGFAYFRDEIPNGQFVEHPCKPNTFWRGVGHLNSGGGGRRNQFGIDFFNNGSKWTNSLCMGDSDGDGKRNGEELGDPDCLWQKGGIPSRTQDITHPGVCTDFYSPQCQGQNDWVDCDKEEFVCPALSRPDTQNITLRFNRTQVPARETTYKCMIFDVPTDEDYHLVAYKPEIDNENVMHHIILYGCEDSEQTIPTEPYDCNMGAGYSCRTMIGGWTLGVPGDCLNEQFGMLFGKSNYKRMALEFHWNNPKKESNWFDSSGLTLYYTSNLRPYNGAVLSLGQIHLEIPPGQPSTQFTSICPAECTAAALSEPIYVAGAVNHMHYLGRSETVEQRRNGSRVRFITNELEYSYDDPHLHSYNPSLEILPNDELITTCTYDSKYSKDYVYYGDATSDEMCFAFLWFYPAEAMPEAYCQSYKSVTVCAVSKKPVIVNGCNAFEFVSVQNPTDVAIFTEVTKKCHLTGHCHAACEDAVLKARQHPCLRGGDITDYVENILQNNKEGLQFLLRLAMCDVNKDDVTFPTAGAGALSGVRVILAVAVVVLRLL